MAASVDDALGDALEPVAVGIEKGFLRLEDVRILCCSWSGVALAGKQELLDVMIPEAHVLQDCLVIELQSVRDIVRGVLEQLLGAHIQGERCEDPLHHLLEVFRMREASLQRIIALLDGAHLPVHRFDRSAMAPSRARSRFPEGRWSPCGDRRALPSCCPRSARSPAGRCRLLGAVPMPART
eukprot:scaffold803_cov310-Pinguiococcus_pyrenoidosus.AAC.133